MISTKLETRLRRGRAIVRFSLLALLLLPLVSAGHDIPIGGGSPAALPPLSDVPCVAGFADVYPCANVDLLAFLPLSTFGALRANDIWGWTDPQTGVEYALLGLDVGTSFVDVSDPTNPFEVGFLPTQTASSIWRDIKVYADHAFIVSEATAHGLQVFDLGQLRGVLSPPAVFTATAHYAGFGPAHNIAIGDSACIAYAVGTNTCAGGLHMIDVSAPQNPVFAGCFSADGYTHDVQCAFYLGPDLDHRGKEICFASNVDTLTVVDASDPAAPVMLSRTSYVGVGYVHQGWLTENQAYFLLGDELDERDFGVPTRTLVWDIRDLDAPLLVGSHDSSLGAIDHNQYVLGDHSFQANYTTGLRVLRMGDLSLPELAEVAYFDTHPADDSVSFSGAWSVYPYFPSGIAVLSDINRGLFVLAPDLGAIPQCADGIDNDLDGLVDLADPHCASASDNRERKRRACGLGFELALLLISLKVLRSSPRRS